MPPSRPPIAPSPAGEATTDFILCSPSGGTATSATELEDAIVNSPMPFREEALNDVSERLYLDDEELTLPSRARAVSQELQSPLLSRLRHRRRQTELNGLNFLNVVTYVAHLFVSWGIGIWGLGGILETRWEIITKYETLVTPAHWAYYLWVPIVVTEGIFSLAQLSPHYRARSLIQDGTGYYFFYTFVIQTAWTFFFSFQLFAFSFIAVVAAMISLLQLLASQHKSLVTSRRRSCTEYTLFRFPFYLHAGWMVLMTVDHLSLLLRRYATEHVGVQVGVDILAMAILLVVSIMAMTLSHPVWWPQQDFVIPLVVIWAYLGIASRLGDPSEAMTEAYGLVVIEAVRYAAFFLAGTVGCCLVPCIVVWLTREFCTIRVVELDG